MFRVVRRLSWLASAVEATLLDQSASAGSELDEPPEGELGLHDDGPAAVQTADADGVVTGQSQDGRRVAVLVDAVAGRLPVSVSDVHLFRVHALHSLAVVDVHAERPTAGQVVVDQLTHAHATRNIIGQIIIIIIVFISRLIET